MLQTFTDTNAEFKDVVTKGEREMSKTIEDKEQLDYKEQLKAFMQTINPKPSLELIEKLKQEYIANRKK
jgi:hypothetical protein